MPAPVAILRWPPVFQQAGCGVAAFDEHALLAHDLARKHSFKKPAIQEDIHEKQFDRCRRNDGRADAACQANNIVDEWASTKAPAAPTLKPVTVDPKTTALLMLDFMNQNCGQRPRCVASIPAMKKLLDAARAAKATVVYSLIANTTAADVIKDVAPVAGEASVLSGPDKFLKTDLEKILKEKGITTVIAVGTSSNGAVLYTGSGAALRGMNVIIRSTACRRLIRMPNTARSSLS